MAWRVVTNSLWPRLYDTKLSIGIITHGVGVIPAHLAGALLCHGLLTDNVENIGNNVFLSLPRTADSNDIELMQENPTLHPPAKSLYCNGFAAVKH